jgi:membrane protein implicated in regulation of membrane protease activity
MTWWLWILFGLALLGAEAVTPGGFFVLFFGVAAVVVGTLAWAGVVVSAAMQWLLFSVLSVACLLILRPRLSGRFSEPVGPASSDYVGESAVLMDDLAPGGVAKAELRGTSWTVRSTAAATQAAGTRCRVERVDGLTLWVVPDGRGA